MGDGAVQSARCFRGTVADSVPLSRASRSRHQRSVLPFHRTPVYATQLAATTGIGCIANQVQPVRMSYLTSNPTSARRCASDHGASTLKNPSYAH